MISVAYVDQPCERCGSKKRVSKIWNETIVSFSGKETSVKCSQIVCTNPVCQAAFDENVAIEGKKREGIRLEKEARVKASKESSFLRAKEAKTVKKNTARI